MQDRRIHDFVNELAIEEERLYERAGDGTGLDAAEVARLHEIEVQLDQAYDLLAQRAARRAVGADPDESRVRPSDIVEGYRQ